MLCGTFSWVTVGGECGWIDEFSGGGDGVDCETLDGTRITCEWINRKVHGRASLTWVGDVSRTG